jgi:hypothetical protein
MRASKFVSGSDPVAALERERDAHHLADAIAFASEAGATVENPSVRIPLRDETLHGKDDGIRFPQFDAIPADLDEDATIASSPVLTSFRSEKPRTRLKSWPFLLLLVLVALQAGPSLLWLRQHLDIFTSRMETEKDRPVAAAPPQRAVAPVVPLGGTSDQSVRPRPIGTAAVAPAPPKSPPPSTGRMSVAAPTPMQVFLKDRLLGTTGAGSIVLPPGNHDLRFVSDAVGYRESRNVTIQAGRTTRVDIAAPTGLLNINANPWAEVWMDNQHIGQTPIGNFPARIGRRQLRFRHPNLGERRASVVVTLKKPVRIAMDLRQKR